MQYSVLKITGCLKKEDLDRIPIQSPHSSLHDGVMFLADLHVHSTFSDGKLTIPELVDFYGKRGFGAIAVTDHICEESTWIGKAAGYLKRTLTPASYPLYIEIIRSEAERAKRLYDLVLIPGFELSKNSILNRRSAHILGIGTSQFIWADEEAAELCRQIRSQGGLAVAAHPVSTQKIEKQTYHLWDRREELRSSFDAWEVASGPYWFDEVAKSGLPQLATSDLHAPWQIESWKTVFECERESNAILEAIRKQEISFKFYKEGGSYELCHHLDVLSLADSDGNHDMGNLCLSKAL